jgi:hypothetical protein
MQVDRGMARLVICITIIMDYQYSKVPAEDYTYSLQVFFKVL